MIFLSLCLQAFKEMLYAAQDQAPSIEGSADIHVHTHARAYRVTCINRWFCIFLYCTLHFIVNLQIINVLFITYLNCLWLHYIVNIMTINTTTTTTHVSEHLIQATLANQMIRNLYIVCVLGPKSKVSILSVKTAAVVTVFELLCRSLVPPSRSSSSVLFMLIPD